MINVRKILRPLKRSLIEVMGGELAISTLRVRLLGSNHLRRSTFYKRFLVKKIIKTSNMGDPADDIFYVFKEEINEAYKDILILYVGDSLTEYFWVKV